MLDFDEMETLLEEYYEVTGGEEPLGYDIIRGLPEKAAEYGNDIVAIYRECIKRGVTWEELLDYQEPPEDAII